ncbi:MAG TPA: hypothetical protein VGG04_04370 [Candidatus Sulfotelmatobacter sp.]
MAAILASRKLNEFGNTIKVPVTIMAIQKAVTWAEQIFSAIDDHWPEKRS